MNLDSKSRVLVAGDVVIDHHLYEGNRASPSFGGTDTRIVQSWGGAALLHELLDCIRREVEANQTASDRKHGIPSFDLELGIRKTQHGRLPSCANSYGMWVPKQKGPKSDEAVWRLEKALGYGDSATDRLQLEPNTGALKAAWNTLVLDDAGLGFRHATRKDLWPSQLTTQAATKPDWIVVKSSYPVATGDLWRTVVSDSLRDRTIVLTSIADLRQAAVCVPRSGSWERLALDLLTELGGNSVLAPLQRCRHLIVCLGCEGALYVDNSSNASTRYRLVFAPAYLEDEWKKSIDGGVYGYMSCLTASVVVHLLGASCESPEVAGHGENVNAAGSDGENRRDSPAIVHALGAGLEAARVMLEEGHGTVGGSTPTLPFDKVAKKICEARSPSDREKAPDGVPDSPFYTAVLPDVAKEFDAKGTTTCFDIARWTILAGDLATRGDDRRPLVGIAHRVAIFGVRELKQIPHQRCGKLLTADRDEIESLYNLKHAIQDYEKHDKGQKPLSVAVFGAPGSGKSFAVKELAKAVLGKETPFLEFNLSQFKDDQLDLIGAFHQVRDMALGPHTPVVFWDEFDSRGYHWLRYLLAPMQDGKFQEGQLTHPIGKCVFVFAGGTSYDFASFGMTKSKSEDELRFLKVPDFKSRLHVYYNVLGPNRKRSFDSSSERWVDDDNDICYPIRRALLLRAFLGLKEDQPLTIDHGVLAAILEVSEYTHGARSMEYVVTQLARSSKGFAIRRSDILPPLALSMHVHPEEFVKIVNRDAVYQQLAESLAPFIHGYWCEHLRGTKEENPYLEEFERLPEEIKDDNRAAAMRIPKILATVGLRVVARDEADRGKGAKIDPEIEKTIEENVEKLAEAEHEGWRETRLANGWRPGTTSREDKMHESLKKYAELSENEKDKDRNSVRTIKDVLATANYTIVWAEPNSKPR